MNKIFIALLTALFMTSAYADGGHGGHHGGGHHGGWGWGWEGSWIFPALIGSAIIYDATLPRATYVQPEPVYLPSTPPAPSWYFCPAANGYYPYVASCPGGWQTVPATPPAPPAAPSTSNTVPEQ